MYIIGIIIIVVVLIISIITHMENYRLMPV